MNTAERLQTYNLPLSHSTLETIENVAGEQQAYTHYADYLAAVGIPNPIQALKTGRLDIRADEAESNKTVLYFPGFCQPLDTNNLFQIATVAHSLPDHRIIAFGNPSGVRYQKNALSADQRKAVANGHIGAATLRLNRYIEQQGIETAAHVGYSFGASLAVAAAETSGHTPSSLALLEPANVIARSKLQLASDFKASAERLGEFVAATNSPLFDQARNDVPGPLGWYAGILSRTNLAYVAYLQKGTFGADLTRAMEAHPGTRVSLIWGSESELALDGAMNAILGGAVARHGAERAIGRRIEGASHAVGNDVFLQAALFRDSVIRA